MIHALKAKAEYFEAAAKGEKTFEVRKHDRPYLLGFSGGKDALVCYDLAKRANVDFIAQHAPTIEFKETFQGNEKDYSEFPPESFLGTLVSGEYGINVGGKCEIEKNCGYECDKSVFRSENDYCSRGARMDGENNNV